MARARRQALAPLQGGKVHALALAATAGLYVALRASFPEAGPGVASLLALPVALAGWWFGRRGGLATAAVAILIELALLRATVSADVSASLAQGWSGELILVLLGLASGTLARAIQARERAQLDAEELARRDAALAGIAHTAMEARTLQDVLMHVARACEDALRATRVAISSGRDQVDTHAGEPRSLTAEAFPIRGSTQGELLIERAAALNDGERRFLERVTALLALTIAQHAHREALTEEEERTRTVAETAFDGMAIDVDGRIRETNGAFAQLFGFAPRSLVGTRLAELLPSPPTLDGMPLIVHARTRSGRELAVEVRARECLHRGRPARITAIRDVTTRIAAETALRDSEERFRTLFENVALGLFRVAPDGRVLLANPALVRMLGYPDLSTLADAEDWKDRLPRAGDAFGDETVWRRRDGSAIHVRASIRAVRAPDGSVLHYEGTIEDITARKEAEAAMRESEALFRAIFDKSPIGMMFAELDGRITEANDAFLSIVRYDRADLAAGRVRWDEMTPREYAHLDARGVAQLREGGQCSPFQKEYVRKDGTRVPVVLAAALVGSADRCVVFVVDVEERERARRALADSQARKSGILDASLDAIVTFDGEGTIQEWNPAAVEMFGMARARAVGTSIEPLVGLRATMLGERRETLATRADGSTFPCEIAVVQVGDKEGVGTYTAFLRDLTSLKRLEAEQRANTEAMARSERLSALGTLVAGVAHEINNPLTYISGNIELALMDVRDVAARVAAGVDMRDAPDLEATVRGLESALGGAERIGQITRALKAVARQRSSKEREVVDVNAVLKDAGALLSVGIPDGTTLEVVPAAEEALVDANLPELHQVVLNLARNAIDALAERGRGGTVRLVAQVDPRHVTIRVEDDGPGIPPDVLSRLFTPFFTTKPQGTGLGLSIVHGIVRDHGGGVSVVSDPRTGTVFSVHLPAHGPAKPGRPAKTAVPLPADGRPSI